MNKKKILSLGILWFLALGLQAQTFSKVTVSAFEAMTDAKAAWADFNAVDFDVKGYAKTQVYGALNYKYYEGEVKPNEVKLTCGIDPLILGVNATVKLETILIDMTLLDYTKEWLLMDRIDLETEKITF